MLVTNTRDTKHELPVMQASEIEITKLDAAQRQLRTALRLWFHEGDPVSIHTLLAAAHEIIHRLYRNKGLVNLIFDSDLINEEFRGHIARKIKEAPNFFKHADQDSNASIKFNPEINALLPMFLVQALSDMGEPLGPEELSYIYWTNIHEPTLFQSKTSHFPAEVIKQLVGTNKKEFLEACELLWSQGRLRNFIGQRAPELRGG